MKSRCRFWLVMHRAELISAGAAVQQMVANIDIAPAMLEAVSLELQPALDGRSLLPLMQSPATAWRHPPFYSAACGASNTFVSANRGVNR